MNTLTETQFPKLRAVDVRPFAQDGRVYLLLRDPLQLTDQAVTIPQALGPLLALCDGTRDSDALRAAFAVRFGVRIGPDVMDGLLLALDEALLFDNERFTVACDRSLAEFRQASHRPPSSAGQSYPADADELGHYLQGYLQDVDEQSGAIDGADVRGLVSPHIDYMRGGPVYARVWKHAEAAIRAADLVLLLGTDHMGKDGALTLTRQHYATPFGVLPTARDVVDVLADALGEDVAFADELHHRNEHSIDLAAVWLHYMRAGEPCDVVPILCGSFGHFVRGEAEPASDVKINALVDAFGQATEGRRVLVVAAADLAHMGPAFGGQPLDLVGRARLKATDYELIERMCEGNAEGFFAAIKRDDDRRNVCGLSSIYLALRMLNPTRGEQIAYNRCPADQNDTSFVSICGVVFS
ncbi:MAG: AmmeMemoRadiSam system protein B [Chloroflexi bacterium]|nr:AmmeMemoRadiSam system protein B [Chloroflexota bacterium]